MSRFILFFLILLGAAMAGGCSQSSAKSLPADYKDPADPANMPAMPQSPAPVTGGEPSQG